jgi:myo-inositol-1(or 4)-monophosphatase
LSAFERELGVARDAAMRAGEVIARHAAGRRDNWEKSDDNPVTAADLEANDTIQAVIRKSFPHDALLSEETADSPERLAASRLWVIDPLDGTKEFIEGVPQYAVSIGLVEDGVPVVGAIYQPLTRECFWASQGGGAFCDETPLRVSSKDRLDQSTMLSSRTEMKRGQVDGLKDWFAKIDPVGGAAFKLALVASGRGDVWVSMAPKSEWDVCAGDVLVREAGGVFVTLDAGERIYNQSDILLQPVMLAGPPGLVDAFRARHAG